MIYESKALEREDWVAGSTALIADGWELNPRQSDSAAVVYLRKPRPDLTYREPRAVYTPAHAAQAGGGDAT
jgi:hypothetical protein